MAVTRKRRVVYVAAIVLLATISFCVISALLPAPADAITQASCDRVTQGMTEAQVEAIFGRRADRLTTVMISLEEPGKPVARQKNWSSRGPRVAVVAFGPDGRAVWANIFELADETWLDRLSRRTGIALPF